jgi:hypothetical protein
MSLDVALVIRGDQSGAKKALDDTASGIETLGRKAETASKPVAEVSKGLKDTEAAASGASSQIIGVGAAAETSGSRLTQWKSMGIAAVSGFAAGLAASGLAAALGAVGEAALGMVNAVLDNSAHVEADLKAHKALIDEIKGAYAEAAGAASQYGNSSGTFLRFEAQQNTARLAGEFGLQQQGLFDRGAMFGTNPLAGVDAGSPFAASIGKFREDLRLGTADVIAFRNEVAQIASALPVDDPDRSVAEQIFGNTEDAARVQEELLRATDLLKGLEGDAAAAATALGGSADKFGALGAAADAINPSLTATDALLKSIAANAPKLPTGGYDEIGPGPRFLPDGTRLFATGGYTGAGAPHQVAGLVHAGEYVFDAQSTAAIGVGNLEAIRRGLKGYAAGGVVGGSAYAGGIAGAAGGSYLVDVVGSLRDSFSSLRGATGQLLSDILTASNPLKELGSIARDAGRSILGFVGNALGSVADRAFGAAGNALFSLIFPGFARGGYTGDGSPATAAGLVHKGEYVFDARSTAAIGTGTLEALRQGSLQGYRSGGLVGGAGGGRGLGAGGDFTYQDNRSFVFEGDADEDRLRRVLAEDREALRQELPRIVRYVIQNPRRETVPG